MISIPSRMERAAGVARLFAPSLLTAAVTCGLMQAVSAHDGPETVIASLNTTMLKTGPTADLLFRRATEFRAIRDDRRAASDLQRALELDGSLEIARLELARLQFKLEKAAAESERTSSVCGEPMKTIEPLTKSPDKEMRTAALALQGEIHLSYCQWQAAIADLSSALEKRPEEIQWALWLAKAQLENGRPMAGLFGLRKCLVATQSPVIRAALCDALIGAAQLDQHGDALSNVSLLSEAKEIIEEELSESRLKSAWLIRRAEVLLLNDEKDPATRDLKSALEELNIRLATTRPDPELIKARERVQQMLR